MFNRRQLLAAPAAFFAAGPAFAAAPESIEPGREIEISLTPTRFAQTIRWSGGAYRDPSRVISLDEGEAVRLTLVNDTRETRTVDLSGLGCSPAGRSSQTLTVRAGQRASIDLRADFMEGASLLSRTRAGRTALRPIRVRPTFQDHPLV